MAGWDATLAATSPRFQDLHARIGDLLRARFDGVEHRMESGMAAYMVPVPDPPAEDDWKGTMPRTHLLVGPTEKKAGVTVHVWHPNEPDLLARNADWLRGAGFKVMVGCLQWNRKSAFPIDAYARLLDAVQGGRA